MATKKNKSQTIKSSKRKNLTCIDQKHEENKEKRKILKEKDWRRKEKKTGKKKITRKDGPRHVRAEPYGAQERQKEEQKGLSNRRLQDERDSQWEKTNSVKN